MNTFLIYSIFSIVCFLVAILFFREENTSVSKVIFPFMMGILSPSKIKLFLRREGIYLIILGYLSFIVGIIVF